MKDQSTRQIAGDANPLEYGGTFLHDGMVWHWDEPPAWELGDAPVEGEPTLLVYRFDPYYLAPFDWAHWNSILNFAGVEAMPPDPLEQSLLVGEYHGWHELDSYPVTYTPDELRAILGEVIS